MFLNPLILLPPPRQKEIISPSVARYIAAASFDEFVRAAKDTVVLSLVEGTVARTFINAGGSPELDPPLASLMRPPTPRRLTDSK
jgi:hypothetical protein